MMCRDGMHSKAVKEKYLNKLNGNGTIKRDNKSVRQWYVDNCNEIADRIDKTSPIEQQAREAFLLRNEYKIRARAMMSDRKTATKTNKNVNSSFGL